jgi:hypothetical protein
MKSGYFTGLVLLSVLSCTAVADDAWKRAVLFTGASSGSGRMIAASSGIPAPTSGTIASRCAIERMQEQTQQTITE